jgi:DNA-directed RNA polymerase specialized sigma24 family protein
MPDPGSVPIGVLPRGSITGRYVRREHPISEADLLSCDSQRLTPIRDAVAVEQVMAIEAAFDELPDHHREVMALSRIARLGRAQVARAMGRSEGSVRNPLPLALAASAAAFERGDREDPS